MDFCVDTYPICRDGIVVVLEVNGTEDLVQYPRVYYLLVLQLYRRRIDQPNIPFWRFTAAAELNDDGWLLLDTESSRWRRKGFRTKIVSLPVEDAAYEIHHDRFILLNECKVWQSCNPLSDLPWRDGAWRLI